MSAISAPMVHGVHRRVVSAGIWGRLCWVALRSYRRPWHAVRAVRAVVAARKPHLRGITLKYARAGGRYFWDLYSPGWPSPAFDRFVEGELDRWSALRDKPPVLRTAIVGITKRCPLRCEHCCEWEELNRRERLSLADLREIVAALQRQGVTQVLLSGGEPLQRFKDVLDLIQQGDRGTDFWLLSSGVGLTVERARQLRQAGLTGVALSLDHHDPTRHDAFRGFPGAFAAVEAGAHAARGCGLVVALSLCPTREFVSKENLERYLGVAERLGAAFVQLLEPRAVGHYAGLDVELSAEQLQLLEDFSLRATFDPAYRSSPLVAYASFTQRRRCLGAGKRYLYVDTDGQVHPCPFCRRPAGTALGGGLETTLECLRETGCPRERGSTPTTRPVAFT
jgi:MoaA/NifB/PqqE/SkfB family radical SAM enzyme